MSREWNALRRRRFVQALLAAGSASMLYRPHSLGQLQAEEAKPPLNRFPRMMQEYLVNQVRASHARSVAAKSGLNTQAEAESYVADVRQKILQALGPFPERTPLNARIMGSLTA